MEQSLCLRSNPVGDLLSGLGGGGGGGQTLGRSEAHTTLDLSGDNGTPKGTQWIVVAAIAGAFALGIAAVLAMGRSRK